MSSTPEISPVPEDVIRSGRKVQGLDTTKSKANRGRRTMLRGESIRETQAHITASFMVPGLGMADERLWSDLHSRNKIKISSFKEAKITSCKQPG